MSEHPGKKLARMVNDGTLAFAGMEAIRDIASYVSDLESRLEKAEAELRGIFASDGNEEARWIEDMKHACPHCGGSGHKDDVRALKSPTPDQGDEA